MRRLALLVALLLVVGAVGHAAPLCNKTTCYSTTVQIIPGPCGIENGVVLICPTLVLAVTETTYIPPGEDGAGQVTEVAKVFSVRHPLTAVEVAQINWIANPHP